MHLTNNVVSSKDPKANPKIKGNMWDNSQLTAYLKVYIYIYK